MEEVLIRGSLQISGLQDSPLAGEGCQASQRPTPGVRGGLRCRGLAIRRGAVMETGHGSAIGRVAPGAEGARRVRAAREDLFPVE